MEWKRGKLPKLPREVLEKAEELEEGLGDEIIVIKVEGNTVRWAPIAEAEWVAAREKGLLEDWQELRVEGEVESRDSYQLRWQGQKALSSKALAVEDTTPLSLALDALWRAYGIEEEDISSLSWELRGNVLSFKARLSIDKETADHMRPYSLEYFIYKKARWEK